MRTQVQKKDFSLNISCSTYHNFEGPHADPRLFKEFMAVLKEKVLPENLVLSLDLESSAIMDCEDQDKRKLKMN